MQWILFSKGQDHSKEIPDSFSHWIEYADSFCLSVTRICTAYYSCEFSFFLQVDKITVYEYMFVFHKYYKCFENTVLFIEKQQPLIFIMLVGERFRMLVER